MTPPKVEMVIWLVMKDRQWNLDLPFSPLKLLFEVSVVKCGRIQVDGKTVPISYVVRPSQKLTHYVHRHKLLVMALDITVLHKEPDVLTICKLATVLVHSCSQYCKNTVVGILEAEYGLAPLFPIHRLDRLVSGLLILARTAAKPDSFRQ